MIEKKKSTKKKTEKIAKADVEAEEFQAKEISNNLEGEKKRTSDRSVLLKELKAKAKKLAESIEGVDTEEIKEEFAKKKELLVPLEDYVKTGIHLGTKVITPDMKKFVYRRRADSIGVLNTSMIDDYIKKAIYAMAKYSPEQIILVCKRESGWESAKIFEEITGIRVYTKKYPAGMMTNLQLKDFYEPELVIVCDSWIDRNALGDATKTHKERVVLCDTNNFTRSADYVIPCNNKGSKSLGLVFYLLARGYIEKKKIKVQMPSLNSFVKDDGQEI